MSNVRAPGRDQADLNLKEFEQAYRAEQEKEKPAPEAMFNYAWALVRADSEEDMKSGIRLFQDLLSSAKFSSRDCLFYLAMGQYRLGNALEARRYLERLLRVDSECPQALALLEQVDARVQKDGWVGIGLAGLAVAAVAGILSALNIRGGPFDRG